MAEETLSTQLPDLRGGVLPARHHRSLLIFGRLVICVLTPRSSLIALLSPHRSGSAASEWGEAGEDGFGAGDPSTGAAAAGAAAPGAGGGTQPSAAQQR